MKEEMKVSPAAETTTDAGISRRRFLNYAGLAGAGMLLVASCKKDDDDIVEPVEDGTVNLGSGDAGLLNYAYALEQLEAAFYVKVCTAFYADITDLEKAYFVDIRSHELAHRELFRNIIPVTERIPDLEFDFGSVNFTDRVSVLTAAKEMEDIGVAAYNGAGKLIIVPANLALAGKIVSVEARHAAYLRNMISYNSFSDTADANGVDLEMSPLDVLSAVGKYLKTKVTGANLPKFK
jgi:hypothetical protein